MHLGAPVVPDENKMQTGWLNGRLGEWNIALLKRTDKIGKMLRLRNGLYVRAQPRFPATTTDLIPGIARSVSYFFGQQVFPAPVKVAICGEQ